MYVSLSADLDISVNVRWTVGTYLYIRTSVGTAYPNGTSKEGRASDVRTKKLSVSLTLALVRRVTVTGILRSM
jgi:hypothetical protein